MPIHSLLFTPGHQPDMLKKAANSDAHAVIMDLEDAVPAREKETARTHILKAVDTLDFGAKQKAVRINGLDTGWASDEFNTFSHSPIDSLVIPKAEDAKAIHELAKHSDVPIWCNIETPKGVLNAAEIAAHENVTALIAGTNDLTRALGILPAPERLGLIHALSQMVLAAKAHGCVAYDGTFIQLDNMEKLKLECQQARLLGFNGKTAIHPKQIETINAAFAPSKQELAFEKRVVEAYEAAEREGKEVTTVDGQMIERLHYERARELLET